MTEIIKNVMVIGAGGNIGPVFVSKLQEAGFNVSILARLASTSTYPANVPVHRTDFSLPSLVKAFHNIDAIVSAVATDRVDDQFIMIDAAVEAKVKRFLPSEYGGDSSLSNLEDIAPFAVPKQNVIEYLKTKEPEGLSWTGVSTAGFFDYLHVVGYDVLGWDLDNQKVKIFDSGNRPMDVTNTNQVGLAVASTLQHLDETKNRRVYVNSFTVTQNQVLEAFERISGRKFEISQGSTTELVAIAKEHLAQGNWEQGYPEAVTAALYLDAGFGYFSGRTSHWNKVLGLPEESLDTAIKAILKGKGWI